MGRGFQVDEIDAFKQRRDRREAREGSLIDQAFRDILAGKFDTDAVKRAEQLGHHDDYPKLKRLLEWATRAARACGVIGRPTFNETNRR